MTLSRHLAGNLLALRRQKRYSQQQLATLCGVPRTTIANMESGSGNPALSNLAAVAEALAVGIEELLARPRPACQLTRRADVPISETVSGIKVHQLLPERLHGLEIIRLELNPGANKAGLPHLRATREYFYGLEGETTVLVAGELFKVGAGDVLAFPGDQAHSYLNRGRRVAQALSVVVPSVTPAAQSSSSAPSGIALP